MTRDRRLVLAAALAALVASGCGGERAGSKLALRYHPPAGASYHYTLEQHNTMKFESGPMAQMPAQQVTMRMYFSQSVGGPTTGGMGVTVRFDSTTLESPSMASGALTPMLDGMRGMTSHVVYDDRMNVVSAELAAGTQPLSPLAQQLGNHVKGLAFPLPDHPVGVGDSWMSEVELPLGQITGASGPIKAQTKLTVKELHAAGPDTTVLLTVETVFPGAPITVTQQGQPITVKLAGNLAGEQLFSVTRGTAVHSSMGGTVRIAVSGGVAGAEGMNLSMQQAATLQLDEGK